MGQMDEEATPAQPEKEPESAKVKAERTRLEKRVRRFCCVQAGL